MKCGSGRNGPTLNHVGWCRIAHTIEPEALRLIISAEVAAGRWLPPEDQCFWSLQDHSSANYNEKAQLVSLAQPGKCSQGHRSPSDLQETSITDTSPATPLAC